MLPGFKPNLTCGLLAKMQKTTKVITEFSQHLIFRKSDLLMDVHLASLIFISQYDEIITTLKMARQAARLFQGVTNYL